MNRRRYVGTSILVLLVLLTGSFLFLKPDAVAGPDVIGKRDGADLRAIVTSDDEVDRIVYFDSGSKTMAGANTPVASDAKCGINGAISKAEVQLVGTMGGTNPTLTILWQNSLDGGATWTSVGTWTVINATVTPITQAQTVSDLAATTAVAYGDCWRATYTFGGTGTVTANFSIKGINK